jgi:hypothetical protein
MAVVAAAAMAASVGLAGSVARLCLALMDWEQAAVLAGSEEDQVDSIVDMVVEVD